MTKKYQVRSGHQRRFVDPTSEKFAITPELVFHGSIFSLQVFIRVPPYTICISQNLYICDLRLGQIHDLYITSKRMHGMNQTEAASEQ